MAESIFHNGISLDNYQRALQYSTPEDDSRRQRLNAAPDGDWLSLEITCALSGVDSRAARAISILARKSGTGFDEVAYLPSALPAALLDELASRREQSRWRITKAHWPSSEAAPPPPLIRVAVRE